MSYFPHAKYPKGKAENNIIKMMPQLFKGIDFGDFTVTLGANRFGDCSSGIIFLYSSRYQENDGAKLVMMLSAIERANGKWDSLETVLQRKDFKKEMIDCLTGKDAHDLLKHKIEDYLDNFGSTRSLVSFFQKNLTLRQKVTFTEGVKLIFVFRKKQTAQGITLIPDNKVIRGDVDKELRKLLRNIIYAIRNNFVHKAVYIILPDKKRMKKSKMFQITTSDGIYLKEHWAITLSFEELNKVFCSAFIRYWRSEYFSQKRLMKKVNHDSRLGTLHSN